MWNNTNERTVENGAKFTKSNCRMAVCQFTFVKSAQRSVRFTYLYTLQQTILSFLYLNKVRQPMFEVLSLIFRKFAFHFIKGE